MERNWREKEEKTIHHLFGIQWKGMNMGMTFKYDDASTWVLYVSPSVFFVQPLCSCDIIICFNDDKCEQKKNVKLNMYIVYFIHVNIEQ